VRLVTSMLSCFPEEVDLHALGGCRGDAEVFG